MHSRATTSPFLGHPSFSTPIRGKSLVQSQFFGLASDKSPSYLLTASTLQASPLPFPYQSSDLPYLESPRQRESSQKLSHYVAMRSLKLMQRAFEVLKEETIMTKLAGAFYANHLKGTAFRVWTESAKFRKFAAGIERGLRKLALNAWRSRAKDQSNRFKSHFFRLKRVFDVLKSLRIASLTIYRKQIRLQKSILQQWNSLAKEAKADRFYSNFCLSAWVQGLQANVRLRSLLCEWRKVAKNTKQVKTQRKLRNRAAVCGMRDRREERMKRQVVREVRRRMEEAGCRRKKVRIRTREKERKVMEKVIKAWKTAAKRDFSAYIRGKKTVRGWKKAASVLAKGKFLQENVQKATLRGVIREIRNLSSSKMLVSVKLSHDFNISRLKTRYFRVFQCAVHKANSLSVKALKLCEISLKKTAFSAFLSMYQRRIRLASISTQQGQSQYQAKRVLFAGLKSFALKSLTSCSEKWVKWLQRRTLLLLFAWRKRTIEGQIEDEQTVVNFRVQKLAKLAFQSISMLTWHKRLIRFKRTRISRFLLLWRNWCLRSKAFMPFSRKMRLPDKGKERKAEAKLREVRRKMYWKRWKFAWFCRQICETLQGKRSREWAGKCWKGWLDFHHTQISLKRAKSHYYAYLRGNILNQWKIAAIQWKAERKVKEIRRKVLRNFRLDQVFPVFRKAVTCSRIIRRNLCLAERFCVQKAFCSFLRRIAIRKETVGKCSIAGTIWKENNKRAALQRLKIYLIKAKQRKEIYAKYENRLLLTAIMALRLHKNRQNHIKTIQFQHIKALFSLWISQFQVNQLLKGNQFTKAVALTPSKMTKKRANIALEWRQRRLQQSLISQWRFQIQLFRGVKEASNSLNS